MGNYKREPGRGQSLKDYWPLIALVLYAFIAAISLSLQSNFHHGMHMFMGIFLLIFSLLKVFDLKHFANGFQMYDLLGKRWRSYCYLFPILEMVLALLYLSEQQLRFTYLFTVVLMGFSSLGVFDAIRRKVDIECPCMGTVLKAPLSTVTLVEDLGMGLMALAMLVF